MRIDVDRLPHVADALGGRLEIDSAAGEGTVPAARLPLSSVWPRRPQGR